MPRAGPPSHGAGGHTMITRTLFKLCWSDSDSDDNYDGPDRQDSAGRSISGSVPKGWAWSGRAVQAARHSGSLAQRDPAGRDSDDTDAGPGAASIELEDGPGPQANLRDCRRTESAPAARGFESAAPAACKQKPPALPVISLRVSAGHGIGRLFRTCAFRARFRNGTPGPQRRF